MKMRRLFNRFKSIAKKCRFTKSTFVKLDRKIDDYLESLSVTFTEGLRRGLFNAYLEWSTENAKVVEDLKFINLINETLENKHNIQFKTSIGEDLNFAKLHLVSKLVYWYGKRTGIQIFNYVISNF